MSMRTAVAVAILAGLAAAFQILLFPPYDRRPLAWVALVPLLLATRRGVCAAAAAGWLFGSLAALGLVIGWLRPALAEFFGASLPVRLALLALASQLGGGAPLAVFGLLAARAAPWGPIVRVPLTAAAWVAVEYGRGQLPYGMPWAPLGSVPAPEAWVPQIADLGGVYAVSFVIAAVNAAVAEVVASAWARTAIRAALAGVVVAAALVAAAAGYGALRRADVERRMAVAPTARVALVHAELENGRRQGAATAAAALDRYLALSPAPGAADLVVWPENAVNLFLEDNAELVARIAAHAGATPYLVGAPRTVAASGVAVPRTSALLVSGGAIAGSYDKRRLLPFAETMPELRGGAASARGFAPGTTAAVLTAAGIRTGPLICYEAIFPELARATVRAGADLLVNLSNDSWFPPGAGPLQHVRFAELRAVETRRTLVRAANRGVTMVVLPDGRIPLATDGRTAGTEIVTVPLLADATVYTAFGDAFAWLCVAVAAAAALVPRRFHRAS